LSVGRFYGFSPFIFSAGEPCHEENDKLAYMVIHVAIDKEQVVVVYNSNDSDSEDFADAYLELHDMADEQKIPVSASSQEILVDLATFDAQITTPIKTYIDVTLAARNIWAIVLGPGVPGGFYDGSDIISSTSRVSRLDHTFSKQTANDLYDRKIFQRFNAIDASFSLICTRIDAPTSAAAITILENSDTLLKQLIVTGDFFFDPYSDLLGTDADEYTQSLLSFQENMLSSLNLDTFITTLVDPYVDTVVPSLRDDSFYWGWFTDRGSTSFFRDTNAIRTFFYNADYDAAITARSLETRNWCPLALNGGYVATAGSMSNPSVDGFLRPIPFFDALLRGATIGEAMLFATPFVDWTIAFFGDPLMKVSFPSPAKIEDNLVPEGESWRRMADNLARAMSYFLIRKGKMEAIRDRVVFATDVLLEVDLLSKSHSLINQYDNDRLNGIFAGTIGSMVNYALSKFRTIIRDRPITLNAFLKAKGYKIADILRNGLTSSPASVDDNNIYTPGSWTVEFTVENESGGFTAYDFDLDISLEDDFSSILYSVSTSYSVSNWEYEVRSNEFESFPSGGLSSSFIGRKVRYNSISSQSIDHATKFYYRIRQTDQVADYGYFESSDVVFR